MRTLTDSDAQRIINHHRKRLLTRWYLMGWLTWAVVCKVNRVDVSLVTRLFGWEIHRQDAWWFELAVGTMTALVLPGLLLLALRCLYSQLLPGDE